MDKRQHRIKANKGGEFPYRFVFFDTETDQHDISNNSIEHTLKFGIALYWERAHGERNEVLTYLEFNTGQAFWDFISNHCQAHSRIVVIAHNLPFDMGVVKGWGSLQTMAFKPTKLIIDFKCNIWRFRRDTTTLLFLDNMNYFDSSLESLGDSLGLKKLPMPDALAPHSQWVEYCKRDVDILLQTWRTWHAFLDQNNLGSFGLTMASQSFNAYRHRFMQTPICVHTSYKAVAIERSTYRGGRNECFSIGQQPKQPYYLLDINSMYPYVMREYEYPVNLTHTGRRLNLDKLPGILADSCISAQCFVSTKLPIYGIKRDGKLEFPIGSFWAGLTTQEVQRAHSRGDLQSIRNYALYDKASIFVDHVDFFYNSRLDFEAKGMSAFAYLCKHMLNSLYGKFGQRSQEWEFVRYDPDMDYGAWQEYNHQEQQAYTYRCINHRVEVCVGFVEGYNSLVAISSEVTANARLILWDCITKAGRAHVYYCDTDSLIVDQDGYDRLRSLIDRTRLGALKLESRSSRLLINNLKDYQFGDKIKIKGISKNAQKIDENAYRQWQSVGIKAGLHDRDINRVIWKGVTKHMSREYTKGIVHRNGKVTPFVLAELPDQPVPLQPVLIHT